MFSVKTLHRSTEDNKFHATDVHTNEDVVIEELFPQEYWDTPEAFHQAGVRGYEPMTAKELETEEMQDEKLADPRNYIEEKFDGTRALLYFLSQPTRDGDRVGFCRVFSRRISKKTGFYVENTDSLPHLRELDVPDLDGTILDGEMFINGLPFKEVSSTLNCLWDKAVDRQIEKGFITLHAFDILFYRGVDLRHMKLSRRKEYLHLAIEECSSPYIEEVKYYECGSVIRHSDTGEFMKERGCDAHFVERLIEDKDTYPNLYKCYGGGTPLTPRAYYELIVATGGEGLIVKPKGGLYRHKRGWEYSKIKKFLTRDMIVIGFAEPTREYSGKDVKKWGFWVDEHNKRLIGNFYGDKRYTPVTKFYYHNQVGNLLLGVLVPIEDYEVMKPNKKGEAYVPSYCGLDPRLDEKYVLMQVCECAGFDDETRDYFTQHREEMIGTVVEVKANELFRDTGKMRHPRYMRHRFDKEPERCVWSDHVGDSEVTK